MRKIVDFLLTLSLIITFLSYTAFCYINSFSTKNVKSNISYLASDDFQGRMCGTIENALAASYIRGEFINNGILPYHKDYLQNFKVKFPKTTNDTPALSIIDKNNKIIETLEYGVNYKEDLLNFRISELQFNKSHIVNSSDNYINIKTPNGSLLIYTTSEDTLTFRSSFMENSKIDLYIFVTSETLSNLLNNLKKDYSIYIKVPVKIQETTVSNVVGYIKGNNPDLPPLILTSHFDHIGYDLGHTIYNGALDNASGTSFMLELSKYIKTLGTPDRDIIFASFNAEEFGLLGSKAFVDNYSDKLGNAKVINFDMIGSYDGVPLCIMGGKKDSIATPMINQLTSIFKSNGIYYNYIFEDASDHVPFINKGISAVTLCDNDTSRIHTPNDKINYISEEAINRCFNVINDYLISSAYLSNPIYQNPIFILITSTLSSFCLILLRKI